MRVCFRWTREARPGSGWLALLDRTWSSYHAWFASEGSDARPDVAATRAALHRFMPELVGLWEDLTRLGGGSDDLARMLGLYCPSAYLSGCSQAVWNRGTPLLIRNYDYSPMSCEATFVHTSWLGTRVIAASDCLWGVLDGINEHGLAMALSFGGRPAVGVGFGIPLILRYALETCRTTREAVAVLRRVPSHMAYNVSVLDTSGDRRVAFVGPDRKTEARAVDVATNHQRALEWPRYDRVAHSVERARFLERSLLEPSLDADAFTASFLHPPLFKTDYARGHGTLYTAAYDLAGRRVAYLWPQARVDQSLEDFEDRELSVPLRQG